LHPACDRFSVTWQAGMLSILITILLLLLLLLLLIIIIIIIIIKGTNVPHPEVPRKSHERSLQNEIMDDFEVLDVNENFNTESSKAGSTEKLPIIYYEDVDFGNSTTYTHSGYTFEDDDKEIVSCESKNKKQKTGFLQNSLSEIVNCSNPSTTTGNCDNRSIKHRLSNKKKVKVNCSYNNFENKQVNKNGKESFESEKIKSLSEISQLMLRLQEKTLELNREEIQVKKDTLETQKGILQELKEMKELLQLRS